MTKAKQARADELGMDKAALVELYDELEETGYKEER